MREPALVAECVAAMAAAVEVPVTVKCRIGVDEQEPGEALFAFARAVKAAGATALVVHARKAWLEGLSPKDNRTLPPLDHALVYALKRAYPDWPIIVNGGIADLAEAEAHLAHVDGVMLGRAAYQNPELLLGVDPAIFGDSAPFTDASAALEAFLPAIEDGLRRGERLHDYTRHLVGLFAGRPGARLYRRTLASEGVRPRAGLGVLRAARGRPGGVRSARGLSRGGGVLPSKASRLGVPARDACPPLSLRRQDEPPAFDRVALQPLEKAHAEQALFERAGPGDEGRHVAHEDRPDGDLVEPGLSCEGRAIGSGDGNVVHEPGGVDAGAPRVGRGEHHHRRAGIEQERHSRAVNSRRDGKLAAQSAIDDRLPTAAYFWLGGHEFGGDPSKEIGRLEAMGVDARQSDEQSRPDQS